MNPEIVKRIKNIAEFTDQKELPTIIFNEMLEIIINEMREKSIDLEEKAPVPVLKGIDKDKISNEMVHATSLVVCVMLDMILSVFTNKLSKDLGIEEMMGKVKEGQKK